MDHGAVSTMSWCFNVGGDASVPCWCLSESSAGCSFVRLQMIERGENLAGVSYLFLSSHCSVHCLYIHINIPITEWTCCTAHSREPQTHDEDSQWPTAIISEDSCIWKLGVFLCMCVSVRIIKRIPVTCFNRAQTATGRQLMQLK